jgi:hypothetical protein
MSPAILYNTQHQYPLTEESAECYWQISPTLLMTLYQQKGRFAVHNNMG